MKRFLLLLLSALSTFAALPEPLPNWKVDLVLQAPVLRHPSVVACAPDGRVFVAEDPMDISLPRADAAEGRILCLQTNGQVSIFATNLYAVFGLQYLEGKVYVLHNPKFSVFDDDRGVGRNRRDLIEQTLPEPSALNWNDHVPANFRLAMDGYFYVASGDKGLYNAKGTDGSIANLSSGGVFRIRPDGSRLEVFADGVRNILDVALNAEDEIFTYDNTDEHDWMGRFTHMVDGGFYGYPHHFKPRRPYTLWMMEDYGAGAACGAFAYNEDALPPEFRGNVFMADFGKRQVMRVTVERDGATYKALAKEDLFPNPPGDFRPVGIALGADGKSIYICDWQHRDEKENVSVGRLLKLTWTGRDYSTPKPAWWLPACSGSKPDVPAAQLIAALAHPSQAVRIAAQRLISDAATLRTLLTNENVAALARVHALWALDRLDGGRDARAEIVRCLTSKHPMLRRQALRQLGGSAAHEVTPDIAGALNDPDASVRFQAATALRRLGEPSAIPALRANLRDADLFARYATFTALNRIGLNTPSAWSEIASGLRDSDQRVREGTGFALRESYHLELLSYLRALCLDAASLLESRVLALEILAAMHHRPPEWRGQWGAYHPALQPPPKKDRAWPGTENVFETLRAMLSDREPVLRRLAIQHVVALNDRRAAPLLREAFAHESESVTRAVILQALGEMKDENSRELVLAQFASSSDQAVLASAIRAAAALGGKDVLHGLRTVLANQTAPPEIVAQSIAALAQLGATNASQEIARAVESPHPAIRGAAVSALAAFEHTNSLPILERSLLDTSPEVRLAAVTALTRLRSPVAVPALLRAFREPDLRSPALAGLSRVPDPRALDPLLETLGSKNAAERNAAHLAIREMSDQVLAEIEKRVGSLPAQAILELRQIYAGNPKAEQGLLFTGSVRQASPAEYIAAGVELRGNAEKGARLFRDPAGLNCIGCHRVNGIGNDTGPDLSAIGAQFDRKSLGESVVFPSKAVREGYQQVLVDTADESFSGIVKSESTDTLILRDGAGREQRISRSSVISRRPSALSLMPEGLHSSLSFQEFADLIEFLTSLKPNKP